MGAVCCGPLIPEFVCADKLVEHDTGLVERVGINLIMLDVVGLPPRMIAILLCACIKETQAGLAKPLSGKVNATHSMESGLEKRRIPDRPGPDALKENENSNKLSFRKTFWLRPSKP